MAKLCEIVDVNAPSEAKRGETYESVVTVENLSAFPIIIRYIHTCNEFVEQGRFTYLQPHDKKEIKICTVAKNDLEKHTFALLVPVPFIRIQDTAEWTINIVSVGIGAKIVKTEFSKLP